MTLSFLTTFVAGGGALAVFVLMVPESAGLVVPSEIVLLAAGAGAAAGRVDPALAVLAGTGGNLVGSLLLYELGARTADRSPRAGTKRARALARCDALFARHGTRAVFVARLMPLARSFVSLPAGRAHVGRARFVALTTLGCAIWAALFVGGGMLAGDAYGAVGAGVRDATVAGLVALAVAWVLRRRYRSPIDT